MVDSNSASREASATKCPVAQDVMRFPQARQTPFDPPCQYQEGEPVRRIKQWNGADAWLVTRYADTRKLLLDQRVSSDASNPAYPAQNAALQYVRKHYQNFAQMDPPDHTNERKLFIGEFMIRRVEELKPGIQRTIDTLIERMKSKSGTADLVADFAGPLPLRTICVILGVPDEDHDKLLNWSKTTSLLNITSDQVAAMMEEFEGYINKLIETKDKNPGDDVLSRVIVNQLRTGQVSHHKVVSWARLFLVAGHESTTNTISIGMAALLYNYEQFAKLRANISLIDSAVEEILRYVDVTHSGRLRVAKEDIELDGVTIKAGDAIIMHQPSANRDPLVFNEPNEFHIDRNPKNHLAFGLGLHQCIGQTLARAELRMGIHSLITNFPDMKPQLPLSDLKFEHHLAIYGLESLPVSF